ncbi:MAG: TPM domain-containing protein [Acidobacteriaceae bacterium]
MSVGRSWSCTVRNAFANAGRVPWSRIGLCFLLLLALFPWLTVSVGHAESVNDLKPTGYVNDFAGVLSPETRSHLEQLCTEVDQQAHAQIAVVTIHTTGDDTIDDFAVRLEEKWKVGQKGTDRGLLFLLATDDHHYRFEVGYGLEGILPDGKVGSIGREMVPYLREGNYDAAVTLATQDVANVIAQDVGVTLKTPAEDLGPAPQPHPASAVKDFLLATFAIFVFISLLRSGPNGWAGFLLGMFLGNMMGGGRGGGGGFGGGDGGGGGFGGFGGGGSGGGGASGSW